MKRREKNFLYTNFLKISPALTPTREQKCKEQGQCCDNSKSALGEASNSSPVFLQYHLQENRKCSPKEMCSNYLLLHNKSPLKLSLKQQQTFYCSLWFWGQEFSNV
jgi:hypothetical protein